MSEEENAALGCFTIVIVGGLLIFAAVVFIVAGAIKWVLA